MAEIRSSERIKRGQIPQAGIRCLVLAIAIILWLFIGNTTAFVYWISVSIVLQFIWSLWSWKIVTGTWFDPYAIFLSAAYLFNGGRAFLEVFRLNEYGMENFVSNEGFMIFSFSTDTISRALLLAFLGLGSLHLGALWAAAKMRKQSISYGLAALKSAQRARLVGWFLLVVSFVPAVITALEKYHIVLESGYFGLFQRQPVTGLGNLYQVLASFMIPGIFFLLAGSKDKPRLLVFCTLIMLIYTLIQALTGTRLWWAMPLVAYVWLWHWRIAPIPRTFLWLGAAGVVFLVFPTIMAVRNLPGAERLTFDTYVKGFLSLRNPMITTLQEMGGTLLTVAHTLELIPAIRDFDFGLGYLYASLTIFPNLFWEIHPALAKGLYSHWLVATVSPAVYHAGGGYGYSFIAEAYANFGWVGTPLVLGLVGFLFAKFVLWGRNSNDPWRAAAVASFLAFFLIYVRGESALVVRALVWYAFLPYIITRRFWRELR